MMFGPRKDSTTDGDDSLRDELEDAMDSRSAAASSCFALVAIGAAPTREQAPMMLSLAGSSSSSGNIIKVICQYCKGTFPCTPHEVTNKGSSKYPSWRCKGCHNATVRMKEAAKSNEQKKELKDPTRQPAMYALQVVRFKTIHEKGLVQRRDIQRYFSELTTFARALQRTRKLMLDECSYVAFHKIHKGWSDESVKAVGASSSRMQTRSGRRTSLAKSSLQSTRLRSTSSRQASR